MGHRLGLHPLASVRGSRASALVNGCAAIGHRRPLLQIVGAYHGRRVLLLWNEVFDK
jgi:hypothetical protein